MLEAVAHKATTAKPPKDTASEDPAPADTAPADTAPADTAVADTAVEDPAQEGAVVGDAAKVAKDVPLDDAGEQPEPRLGMFRSLRNHNFRLYAAGQVVSNTGTWMQRVAQDWLVLELAHGSGTALGITTGLQFLPMLLFGLWGGVIADRYPKRRVLMMTQVSMGVLALILGVLVVTGAAQVWHVYLLAFGLGVATVVDNPSRQAFVVEMVGRRDLPNAIALNSATFNGARLLGPAVAGVLIALIGTGPVFLVNAASFGAVLFGLYAMRTEDLHHAEPVKRAKGQLREGLRYVRGRRDLMLVLILVGFLATFGMNFTTTVALVAKEVFHTDASAFGLASSMLAVGALSGALLAARRVARPRLRLLVAMGLAFGTLEVLTGLMPTYWSFLALLVPTGIAMMTITTAANATVQLGVAPEMRGRVMALYMLVFLGTNPVGAPAIGWLAEHYGARTGLVLGGLVSVLAALAVGALALRRAPGEDGDARPVLARLRRPRAAEG
ncbi:Predicted arabinose efflux permease, MFS family [Actinomadura madurae]|uniref:Predicted arabinose efflux permease, MFS family n=2 Tax=Actinomadura madurae TaxID=1993 RepID=A0A1I5XJA4_9ACTN|nr:Predicted arabinose efflux permease, MFS family [Actinomadura madurae]